MPAQITCLVSGFIGGCIASFCTDNMYIIVGIASWSDLAGFYGYFIVHDVTKFWRSTLHVGRVKKIIQVIWKTARGLTVEFGASELVDTIIIRPACIYYTQSIIGNMYASFIIGIIVSDIWMMGVCPIFFKLRKRIEHETHSR